MKRLILILSIIITSFTTFAYDTTTWNKELELAAKNGDPEAMFYLGVCYSKGKGVAQNYEKAVEWYRKSADLGDEYGMYNLGCCYEKGKGVAQNYEKAVEWYRKAADLGYEYGMVNLGYCYEKGTGVTQNYMKAVEWYRKAADLGFEYGMFNLGYCYAKGTGVTQNYMKAVEWYRKAAVLGCVDAMVNLGYCYEKGTGVAQNYEKAVEWYRKAADLGHRSAMNNLGICYNQGTGVAQNYEKAVEWYRKSADLGYENGMFNLGCCYDKGTGVTQDYMKAVEWYRKAADLGHRGAMNNLGICYKKGTGVAQNYEKAVEWYRKAAESGNSHAMFNLATCYEDGNGVAQSYEKAVEWYRKAADMGNSGAIAALTRLYEFKGNQVTKIDSKEFPVLDIEKVEFVDNGNNIIEAGEKCHINVTVLNSGKGVAKGCKLKVTSSASGISVDDIKLQDISAGKSITQSVEVNAGLNTVDGKAEFNIVVDEPNGMGPDPSLLSVATQSFQAPKVLVSDYSITSDNGSKLQKRVPFDLQILVQNLAQGNAEDVAVSISLPQNVFLIEGDESKKLGKLSGGETKELNYYLLVNNNYSSATIPVKINLKEKYGKYAENMTINLQLDQTLAQNKIEVKANNNTSQNNVELAKIKGKLPQSEVDIDIPSTSKRNNKTFAVFIGNENYKNEIDVPFAINDATVMAQYFNSTLGLPNENIRIVTDATRNDIIDKLDWLRETVNAFNDADIILYYSGHGMPDEATKSPMLVPVDGRSTNRNTCFALQNLYDELSSMNAHSITIILDACFSGASRDDNMLLAAKGVRIKADGNQTLDGSMVVLSASKGSETAFPYKDKAHGMFTYFLLKKLQDSKGNITLGELSDYVTEQVRKHSITINDKPQTPSTAVSPALEGKWRNIRW